MQIFFQADWWLHILASLCLWGLFYLLEEKYFQRKFNKKDILVQILLANLIDLDHLLSTPIYDAARCSINNHILHSYYLFLLYIIGLFSRYRYFFASLIVHLFIDYIACI